MVSTRFPSFLSRCHPAAHKLLDGWEELAHLMDAEAVRKYLVRPRKPRSPSTTWLPFSRNHLEVPWAVDIFVVTPNPTMERMIQRLREALPFGEQPRYLFRDNDGILRPRGARFPDLLWHSGGAQRPPKSLAQPLHRVHQRLAAEPPENLGPSRATPHHLPSFRATCLHHDHAWSTFEIASGARCSPQNGVCWFVRRLTTTIALNPWQGVPGASQDVSLCIETHHMRDH